jgi:hypothetical protein
MGHRRRLVEMRAGEQGTVFDIRGGGSVKLRRNINYSHMVGYLS